MPCVPEKRVFQTLCSNPRPEDSMVSGKQELLAEIAREEARLAELARQHEAARSRMAALRAKLAALSPEEPAHSVLPVAAVLPALTTPAAKVRLFRALFRGRDD